MGSFPCVERSDFVFTFFFFKLSYMFTAMIFEFCFKSGTLLDKDS